MRYDHGTWTRNGGFAGAGATAGAAEAGTGGAVTIDVPGLAPGGLLTRSFVLTYDGVTGAEPHWVDRAPGGVAPDGSEYGADYTVGSCSAALPGAPPPAAGTVKTTAVALSAPKRRVGSGTARVTGRITPARAGVAVKLSAAARQSVTRRTTTGADGSFRFSVPLSETTRLRAVVEGIGSQTLTVTVVSKVRITVKRTRSGAVVTGSVSPALPGRVLWLRTNAVRSSAKTTARSGRFTLRLAHPRRGRYQAVFIPSGNRAERSTSNTGVVR